MFPLFAVPAVVVSAPADPPASPANPVAGYRAASDLNAAIRAIADAHPDRARVETIGRSREGREILALRLGSDAARPALLLTGGLDGSNLVSSETAVRVAAALATKPETLDRMTVWVIVRANPDALDATLRGPVVQVGTSLPVDDDRDGAADEDGPKDLDGDGVIVQMRVKNPKPPYVASLVADPSEQRLMKSPDATKGELATYAVFSEGIDADGDGLIAEDGRGTVDLDKNFPHRYPEFAPDAGPYQISEPESKALVDFVIAHPEIVAAITYGRHDTLVKMPDTKDMDVTGRTPLVYHSGDHALYQEIGKLYRDTTGQKRTANADPAGSFWLWLADHRGLLSIASTVYGRPDTPKPEAPPDAPPPEARKPDAAPAPPAEPPPAQPGAPRGHGPFAHDPSDEVGIQDAPTRPQGAPPAAPPGAPSGAPAAGQRQAPPTGDAPPGGQRRGRGGRGPGGGPPGSGAAPGAPAPEAKPADEDAKDWLDYLDKTRGGAGFVPWHEVDHPLFGRVEVGGFHPLVRTNPPANELDALAEKQVAFIAALVERLPTIEIDTPTVTKLADGVWRIETSLANAGKLPTATRMGRTTRTVAPLVVRVSTPIEKIVTGQRVRIIDGVDPGERVQAAWIVRAAPGETIDLSVRCGPYVDRTFKIRDGAVESSPVAASTEGAR